VRGKTQVPGAS